MSTLKRYWFSISHGTYPGAVVVALMIPSNEIIRVVEANLQIRLTREERKAFSPHYGGVCTVIRDVTILWVAPAASADFYGNLGHEIFHAVEMLFVRLGVQYQAYSEAYAYQISLLTRQIYEQILPG